jgi:hypothetical protein
MYREEEIGILWNSTVLSDTQLSLYMDFVSTAVISAGTGERSLSLFLSFSSPFQVFSEVTKVSKMREK